MKAFPTDQLIVSDMGHVRAASSLQDGMDLRDYFAARAMQSLIIAYATIGSNLKMHEIIDGSYQYADAMMEARK